ncbi:hypothetical protein N7519_004381 [Penicillium mononematosum]|uniref:uncharacterized protein n=1 Tax=Penicillium mononematosum TaxID=268346 RepID=UPI002548222D|nr:uncharacterized protein N7519_004381 [Penicillium mononematosum]KAJ6189473.1 hypothetical protein N7519_004381 [Penicillium mononematosum]
MSAPQTPSAGNNDYPDPAPNTGPNTGTSTSTGTSTGTDSTSQGSYGSYWRGYSINPPRRWSRTKKRICDCPNHVQEDWPFDFAELIIAPCAYKCPFCNDFNKALKTKHMASNLRRHITKTHIEGNPDVYSTLVVAPGGMK